MGLMNRKKARVRWSECCEPGKEGGAVTVVGWSQIMQSLEALRFKKPGILLRM